MSNCKNEAIAVYYGVKFFVNDKPSEHPVCEEHAEDAKDLKWKFIRSLVDESARKEKL